MDGTGIAGSERSGSICSMWSQTQEMNSGDPSPCGPGDSPVVVQCVKNACQDNMTQRCVDRMMIDFELYALNLNMYCRLDTLDGDLTVALSLPCRRVCNMDRDACRLRRQTFCSTRVGTPDSTVRQLCSCYWPKRVFFQLIEDTLRSASLSSSTVTQLASIADLLRNGINYPYCWSNECTQSSYGTDTEIVLPCPTIGLCVQSIDVTKSTLPPNVVLTNNCTLNTLPVEQPPIDPTPRVQWEIAWTWVYAVVFSLILLLVLFFFILLWKLTPQNVVVPVPVGVGR